LRNASWKDMGASLLDLQWRFAASLTVADPRTAAYRNTITANYRNALRATYPVVRALTGAAFFDEAVDAFTVVHPSTCGDLNVYGAEFGDFLASYPYGRELAYLPDVARLEWAIDEASRAGDSAASAEDLFTALGRVPADAVAARQLALDPSCRLVGSRFPVMRIWQVHQSGVDGQVDLDAGADHLLVRRERDAPTLTRIAPEDFAFLAALATGADLASALEAAVAIEGDFDLAAALRTFIADGTIASLA
jgi:putative DNA-binding protein